MSHHMILSNRLHVPPSSAPGRALWVIDRVALVAELLSRGGLVATLHVGTNRNAKCRCQGPRGSVPLPVLSARGTHVVVASTSAGTPTM